MTSFISLKSAMPPQNSNPVQRIQSFLAICSYVSNDSPFNLSSVSTMKNEEHKPGKCSHQLQLVEIVEAMITQVNASKRVAGLLLGQIRNFEVNH